MKKILNLIISATILTNLNFATSELLNNKLKVSENTNQLKGNTQIEKINNLDLGIENVMVLNKTIWARCKSDNYQQSNKLYKSIDQNNFKDSSIKGQVMGMTETTKGIIYLAKDWSIFKSDNGGETFNKIFSFPDPTYCIAINSNDVMYVGAGNIFYQSTDGIVFNKMYVFPSAVTVGKILIAHDNTIFVQIANKEGIFILKSTDTGYTFNYLNGYYLTYDMGLTKDDELYFTSYNGIYRSIDNYYNLEAIPNSEAWQSAKIVILNDRVYLSLNKDVWKLNLDDTFSKIASFDYVINTITKGNANMIWVSTKRGLFKLFDN